MAAADVCSNCHNKDISQILEENSDLKMMIDSLKLWLQSIPSEWQLAKQGEDSSSRNGPEEDIFCVMAGQELQQFAAGPGLNGELVSSSQESESKEEDTYEFDSSMFLGECYSIKKENIEMEDENLTAVVPIEAEDERKPELGEKSRNENDLGENCVLDPVKFENDTKTEGNKRKYDCLTIANDRKKKFQCDLCEYSCSRAHDFKKHKKYIHGGLRFPCDQCEFTASNPGNVKLHIESKHMGIRYPCDECDYVGTRPTNIKVHKESIHLGIRYSCNQCEHKARSEGHLKKHKMSLHDGIRYPCELCDYKATKNDHLKRHIESVHMKIRFACDQCEFSSPRADILKKHKTRTHLPITVV